MRLFTPSGVSKRVGQFLLAQSHWLIVVWSSKTFGSFVSEQAAELSGARRAALRAHRRKQQAAELFGARCGARRAALPAHRRRLRMTSSGGAAHGAFSGGLRMAFSGESLRLVGFALLEI
jgi:hypothetical protein